MAFVVVHALCRFPDVVSREWLSADSFAVGDDGRFLAVGTEAKVRAACPGITKVVDAGGLHVIPGFFDSHLHLVDLGTSLFLSVDLAGCSCIAEACRRVADWATTNRPRRGSPGREWIVGGGWDHNHWPNGEFPTARDLDQFPELAQFNIVLFRVDIHAVWCNSTALRQIEPIPTVDTPGGKVVRYPDGTPTGILIDHAQGPLVAKIPQLTFEERCLSLKAAFSECNKFGVVGAHDAYVDQDTLTALKHVLTSPDLTNKLRVYSMLAVNEYKAPPPLEPSTELLTVRACKILSDGALGSRGAALFKPYSDDPKNTGLLLYPDNRDLTSVVRKWIQAGYQVCTHAIGDLANHNVLDAYTAATTPAATTSASGVDHSSPLQNPMACQNLRLRIEHSQIVTDADLPRFSSLNLIASMQPTHCTSDMGWVTSRVGPEREHECYRWNDFHKSGVRLCFGSDSPVEIPDPLAGIVSATSRCRWKQGQSQPVLGPWHSDQCVSRTTALNAYTIDAAYASFLEQQCGTMHPGFWADFVVLSGDLLECPVEEIGNKVRVIGTFVGGHLVYGTPFGMP
ncbi:Amidohydrolase 3 [Pelomyxa schiedti]|nr:Amidohydrolase 3 [Pelomyxa schiedti]